MNKTKHLLVGALVLLFGVGLAAAPALATTSAENTPTSVVTSISLHADTTNPGVVEWTLDGVSAQGFKVVWSKNENPTYPLRDGDQYHYYSDANATHDNIAAFNGAGVYYGTVAN